MIFFICFWCPKEGKIEILNNIFVFVFCIIVYKTIKKKKKIKNLRKTYKGTVHLLFTIFRSEFERKGTVPLSETVYYTFFLATTAQTN